MCQSPVEEKKQYQNLSFVLLVLFLSWGAFLSFCDVLAATVDVISAIYNHILVGGRRKQQLLICVGLCQMNEVHTTWSKPKSK